MFGAANQLLATFALVVATSFIINRGKIRYVWVTGIPLVFVGIVTITAGITNMFYIYLPMMQTGQFTQGFINFVLTALIELGVFIVFFDALPKWIKVARGILPVRVDVVYGSLD
jgi:carbon starvation protein